MEGDFGCTEGLPVKDLRNRSIEVIHIRLLSPVFEEILTYTVFAVVVCVGLIANILFLFVVYRDKKMHTVMNAYLVNLAVADIIILGYGYTDRVYYYASSPVNIGSSLLGPLNCVVSTLFEFTYYSSLSIVTLFSMERYIAICYPMKHIQMSSARRTTHILVWAWVISFVLAALQIPGRGKRETICIIFPEELGDLTGDHNRCMAYSQLWARYIRVILQLLPFYAALVGVCYFYTAIVIKLRTRQTTVGDGDRHSTAAITKARNAATRMIIINGCVFFLCNAPMQFYVSTTWVFNLVGYTMQLSKEATSQIFLVLTILLYLNSAINPFIYGATNPQYRRAFLNLLPPKARKPWRKYEEVVTATSAI